MLVPGSERRGRDLITGADGRSPSVGPFLADKAGQVGGNVVLVDGFQRVSQPQPELAQAPPDFDLPGVAAKDLHSLAGGSESICRLPDIKQHDGLCPVVAQQLR
jgi:hypothetical protein